MPVERTLSIIKPDAVKKNAIGKILARFETAGLRVVAARMMHLSRAEAEGFYAVHRERPFFRDLVAFMTSGPVLVQVLEGDNAVAKNRELMGATDPKKAAKGTIRADFADSIDANAVHGSDSVKNAVEAVFIPETRRGPLCISSQAGCVLDCEFCSTGKQGFNRDLSTAEIIGQVWLAKRMVESRISNVVLMGMGEPLLNLDNVLPALRLMLDDNAYGLSRRRVTVSTAGVGPGMDPLRDECPVALAVSLHAPNDALRDRLVPLNRKYPLRELLKACDRYLEKAPRDFITFEYVMLDGVNDGDAHARELAAISREVRCKYNLIPFNPFPRSGFERSGDERIRRFAAVLQQAGVTVTTRKTRGDDIAAACGQLAGDVADRTRRAQRRLIAVKEVRA